MRRLVALILTIAFTVVVGVDVASAAGGSDTSGGTGSGGSAGDVIFAGVQFGTPPAKKGANDQSGCFWIPAGEAATVESGVVDKKVVNGITYLLFLKACPTRNQGVWVPQVPARILATSTAARVKDLLAAPAIGSAPQANDGVVKVGMWFWTQPEQYRTHSITAWVPTTTGIAWTTTTATPIGLVYSPGEPDSQPIRCAGPGAQWNPSLGDESVSPCMYTYQHSSEITATGTFAADLSIIWSITWRSNVSAGGTLSPHVTTTHAQVVVREIQAVVSA